ncbi:MAG: hypothetical protein M0D53_13180 [Flavobacterium sp. JAD_PAG50586_2]|nr:MAG: hypothetical protein M0D53_13180 [Flavobacterium sp. JAD_PAG50586_2]
MAKSRLLADFNRYNLSKINFRTLFFVFISHPIPGLKFLTIFRMTQHYRRKNRLLFYFSFCG